MADDNGHGIVMEVPEIGAMEEIVEGDFARAPVESSPARHYSEGSESGTRKVPYSSSLPPQLEKYMYNDDESLKVFESGVCAENKVFRYQCSLAHHSDERDYLKCGICGKAFGDRPKLLRHQVVHSDARPYTCYVCDKAFKRVTALTVHCHTHSEAKPHECQVCGKGFRQKAHLKTHLYIHSSERPYKCTDCGHQGFNQKVHLMRHRIKYHSVGSSAGAEQFQFV